MKTHKYTFTSESVTEGHPDKLADQISDAVLDSIIERDPMGRVACETLLTTGLVIVAGEVTTNAYVEIPDIVRRTLEGVGYTRAKYGFDFATCGVLVAIQSQSPDIAQGVDTGGAGDQGMMFGFACDETPEMMPLPIMLAHKLCRQLAAVRKNADITYLRPDGKSQVTVEYQGYTPVKIQKVVVSAQHQPNIPQKTIHQDLVEHVIKPVLPKELIDDKTEYLINPTGSFSIGGPQADTGLTGRKIIVDTYGGMARHGGGCFSGKDPTKVDRSGAYVARFLAKNTVAAGMARRCELRLAYAIGVPEPLAIGVDTFGTGAMPDEAIEELVKGRFDLTPRGVIELLDLRRPIYLPTARNGHFGKPEFSWERMIDLAR